MPKTMPRKIAISELIMLVGLTGIAATSGPLRVASAALLSLAAVVVLAFTAAFIHDNPRRTLVAALALASTIGLVAAVVYLHSLPPDSADIPLAGVGLLLLSVIGLVGTGVSLSLDRRPDET